MVHIVVSGKRKTAIARAVLNDGRGDVFINRRSYTIIQDLDRLRIEEPLKIAQIHLGSVPYDIHVTIRGGGEKGQIEAARLAIARALVEASKSPLLKKAYAKYDKGLLVADTRRKEPRKPGDSKARAKRQKSYR